jgi:hypothetical protein
MDLSGTAGDAWEILANVGGKHGHHGSCALKALPDVQARSAMVGSCIELCGSGEVGEVTFFVLVTLYVPRDELKW